MNAIIFSIFIWFLFGLQHSFFARNFFKTFLKSIFGQFFINNLYPLIYFLSQCIIFVLIYDLILNLKPNKIFFSLNTEFQTLIFFLNKLSNIFLILTIFHFDIGKFIGLSQLFNLKKRDKVIYKINDYYLYRYIRHPMYLGILLTFLTSTTIYTDLFFINFFCILLYVEIGSFFEEKSLIIKFGNHYEKYRSITKKYIPFIR